MESVNRQLFIEGENNQLFIYVHLQELCKKKASSILDIYVKNFKKCDFEKINVSFWNVNVAGEHLSAFRKKSNEAISRILKGFKFIDSSYDFKQHQKVMTGPQLIV